MNNLIAFLGPKRCPWCVYTPSTRIERFMRGDELIPWNEMRFYERAYWSFGAWTTEHLPIWKLAQKWHFARHSNIVR